MGYWTASLDTLKQCTIKLLSTQYTHDLSCTGYEWMYLLIDKVTGVHQFMSKGGNTINEHALYTKLRILVSKFHK